MEIEVFTVFTHFNNQREAFFHLSLTEVAHYPLVIKLMFVSDPLGIYNMMTGSTLSLAMVMEPQSHGMQILVSSHMV